MKFISICLMTLSLANYVQGQESLPLYSGAIPNSKPSADKEKQEVRPNGMAIISGISIPTITVFLPQKPAASRCAIIIFPGGGYHINAIRHEGLDVAKAFNELGVAAFVVKYRIPNEETMVHKEIGPLQDAQQAIRLVRQNAAKWNIDPNKTGIMGFSAGGHLASTAGTHFKKAVIDNAAELNLRPDFMVLGYPVISFSDSIGHTGSRDNLLGKSPSHEKVIEYSNERQVTTDTPPTFLIHASDDKVVVPANSIVFFEQLLKHGVPAELHIYERGGHGFGMNNPTSDEKWMNTLANWLTSRGFLTR